MHGKIQGKISCTFIVLGWKCPVGWSSSAPCSVQFSCTFKSTHTSQENSVLGWQNWLIYKTLNFLIEEWTQHFQITDIILANWPEINILEWEINQILGCCKFGHFVPHFSTHFHWFATFEIWGWHWKKIIKNQSLIRKIQNWLEMKQNSDINTTWAKRIISLL